MRTSGSLATASSSYQSNIAVFCQALINVQGPYPERGSKSKEDRYCIREPAVQLTVPVHRQPHQHRPAEKTSPPFITPLLVVALTDVLCSKNDKDLRGHPCFNWLEPHGIDDDDQTNNGQF